MRKSIGGAPNQPVGSAEDNAIAGPETAILNVIRHELRFAFRGREHLAAYDSGVCTIMVTNGHGSPVRDASCVACDKPVRESDYCRRTPITLRELEGPHIIVAAQVAESPGACPIPLVDDLVVVRHDEQIVASGRGQESKEIVLRPVGILEFVHAHVRPAQANHPGHSGLVPEQSGREMEQAAEIELVGPDQSVAVSPKELGQPVGSERERGGLAPAGVGFREQSIDELEHVLPIRWQFFTPVRQVANDLFEDGDSVLVTGQRLEVGPNAEMASVLPQHIGCERMEGAQVGPLGVLSQQVIHPLPHFGRGLVRERKGQRGSVLILFNQAGYPQREHAGLSGAWACENQKGPILPLHSPPLVLVEVLEGDHGCFSFGSSFTRFWSSSPTKYQEMPSAFAIRHETAWNRD